MTKRTERRSKYNLAHFGAFSPVSVKLAKYRKFWTSQSVQTGVIFVMETDFLLLSYFQDFSLFERIAFNKFLVGIRYCSLWKDFLKSRIELINLEHVFWHFNIINDANSECLFFLLVDLYLLLHTIIAQKKICFLSKENKFFTFPKIPARTFTIFVIRKSVLPFFAITHI